MCLLNFNKSITSVKKKNANLIMVLEVRNIKIALLHPLGTMYVTVNQKGVTKHHF